MRVQWVFDLTDMQVCQYRSIDAYAILMDTVNSTGAKMIEVHLSAI